MKSILLLSLLLCVPLSAQAQTVAAPESVPQRVTLYGPLARGHDASRALLSFKTGTYGRRNWDLTYGSLYAGKEHDWLQVSTADGVRTAIRDLGARTWTDSFKVPVVEPFPKLKEGEQRRVVVNADGADGKPGRSAAPKVRPGPPGNDEESLWGAQIANANRPSPGDFPGSPGYVEQPLFSPKRSEASPSKPRPRRDGVPKVDPIYTRAVVGHMYAVHVVDRAEDFYVLFRVESLVRGDNCTITWKRVPAPTAKSANRN
jgi:hypothetical protein